MYQSNQMFPGFQQVYQPSYQDRLAQLQAQYQQAMPPHLQQAGQGILWVQGDSGAKAYMMAPSTTVLLMDSEGQKFYLKSTDASGVPSLRTFEYTEVQPDASQALQKREIDLDSKYVTREEYEEMQGKFKEIMERLKELQPKE